MEGEIARNRHPSAVRGFGALAALAALLAPTLGCGLLDAIEPGLAPLEEPSIAFAFSSPEMLTVKPGDTLAVLAKRHKVTVADLKSWNGLVDDTIEVDQVLLIWTVMPAPPRVVAAKPQSGLRGALESVLGTAPAPTPAPVVAGAPPGTAEATPATPDGLPAGRVSIERPMLVGLLGMQTGTDVDLEAAAAGMQRHDADLGGGGLGERSLTAGSNADDLVVKERQMRNLGPQIPNTPVSAPRLSKPAPKRCLGGPSGTISEEGVATSGGLTAAQINSGMGAISRHVVRCFPSGTKGSYTVIVEVTAGCDGRVSNVFVQNAGVVPSNVSGCIQQTLSFAAFPAHAVPNGVDFQYPLKFTF